MRFMEWPHYWYFCHSSYFVVRHVRIDTEAESDIILLVDGYYSLPTDFTL
jgi:hypothetical protein